MKKCRVILLFAIMCFFTVVLRAERSDGNPENPRLTKSPPVRAITHGPKYHWFGYYDKYQFDPTGRFVLAMEVDFEGRSPRADDVIKVGMIDLMDNDRWIELGETRAWNWQQGCMLQWLPGSMSKVIWNDRQGDKFVSHVLDVFSGEKKTLTGPVYSISPDGKTAIFPDFRRLNDLRPGYGYAGIADPFGDDIAPEKSGIWKMDMETGKIELIISVAQIAKMPYQSIEVEKDLKHYFNHLLFNPDGSRFIFLHRRTTTKVGRRTRMFTAAADGSDIRLIDEPSNTSHFIWRDPGHFLTQWDKPLGEWHFYLVEDTDNLTQDVVGRGIMCRGQHASYLPDKDWIINDTYPIGPDRIQYLFLYHVPTGKQYSLGEFPLAKKYKGEWRVDLHARCSRDGNYICIDSPHGAQGRQLYLIDISDIVVKQ